MMYIETQSQYSQFQSDELTDLLSQITFKINNFGLWTSEHDTKASYISNDIEIVYYQKGGSTTIIGDKKYICHPGDFLVLEPYQLNTSINEGRDNYEYYYFHFEIEPLYLRHQFINLLLKHGHLIEISEMDKYKEMFKRLYGEAQQKEIGYSSIITSALIRIVVEIMRNQLKRCSDTHIAVVHSPYIELINEAIGYIQENIREPIRLVSMSQTLGVSKGVLYKAFVAVLGTPPATYIHQQKIQYVQKKLLLGESVSRIAQELNYSSAYHLSKAFKKYVGISPKEYKKNMVNM